MSNFIEKSAKKFLGKMGYSLVKSKEETHLHPDIKEKEFWEIYNLCSPYTMTSIERIYALFGSVNYILSNNIPGDFVECGVWRGGSSMMIAQMLSNRNITDRKIYLYDTFEGMSAPTDSDKSVEGQSAAVLLEKTSDNKETSFIWCLASLEDVKNNMSLTKFPENHLVYIKGKVEETIPAHLPGKIALLRLDTDWYESTRHELNFLFPLLTKDGVLIIDDYGHWEGCRKAVDEYFKEQQFSVLLNRVDYTGRVAVKNF